VVCNEREKAETAGGADGRSRSRFPGFSFLWVVAVVSLLGLAAPALAQSQSGGESSEDCTGGGVNGECNAFGKIAMQNREEVRGEPVDVNTTVTLNTSYEDRGARWVMFSVRNVTADGDSPVSIRLNSFATDEGEVVTTRVVHEEPNELNLWVDVLDLPVHKEIEIDVTVGVTDEGAYAFETLVLAFDRGYDPVQMANGDKASLFSYTLLGVNEATEPIGSSTSSDGALGVLSEIPAPSALATLGTITLAAAACLGREPR
jgi:hypothetical protein